MSDILFILKKRNNHTEWPESYTDQNTFSSGLYNSVKFLNDELCSRGYYSNMVEVVDNNSIDRVVTEYKPSVVIIEALWVVPEKFEVLTRLHPNVKWVVRIHSEIPFLANEGNAIDWLSRYDDYSSRVHISTNSYHASKSLESVLNTPVFFAPNFYPLTGKKRKKINKHSSDINISCFGAIRPMKNHLMQAVAAINFADSIGKNLNFHVNSVRLEQRGDSVLRNLEALFEHNEKHSLVKCQWMPHKEFKQYISDNIDIGMQVSFSETFNIVTADHIDLGVPVVTSKEVEFVFSQYQADPTNEIDIRKKLLNAYTSFSHSFINTYLLERSNAESMYEWGNMLRELGVD